MVKKDIVNYAATHWLKEFSRVFDGFVASGPNLPKIAVRLACNSQGLLVFSSENRDAPQLLSLSYSQIKKVSSLRYVDRFLPWKHGIFKPWKLSLVILFTFNKRISRRFAAPSQPSFCYNHPTPRIATLWYYYFFKYLTLSFREVPSYYKPHSLSSLLSTRKISSYSEHQVQKFK